MTDPAFRLHQPRASSVDPLLPFIDRGHLFTSSYGQVFFHLADGPGQRIFPVRSREFRDWLLGAVFAESGAVPSSHALHALIHLLEARAARCPESAGWAVGRRIGFTGAYTPEKIFVDLASAAREFVEISPHGWTVTAGDPRSLICLATSRSMREQFAPQPSENPAADLEILRTALNLPRPQWLRALVWLLSAFRPRGPYPILVLQGPPGSGKSFAASILRTLVDPATAALTPVPASVRELYTFARQNWVLAFDHISAFAPQLSAALCRLSSTAGLALRERGEPTPLHESCSRPILLTVTDRWSPPPEFAGRCLTLTLPSLAPAAYRSETCLRTALHPIWPRLLGAVYSSLSAILAAQAAPASAEDPEPAGRHVNVLAWSLPAAPILGVTPDEFRAALAPAPAPHPLVEAIRTLLDQCRSWTGTATDLQALLQPAFDCAAPQALSHHLKKHALILSDAGIELKFKRLHEGQRVIRLEGDDLIENSPERSSPNPPLPSQPQQTEELTPA